MRPSRKKSSKAQEILFSLVQRVGFGLLVLLAIIYLSYFGLDMARGQTFQAALVDAGVKSLAYIGRLVQGNLGLSDAGSYTLRPVPIAEIVPVLLGRSLGLLLASLLFAAPVGVVLGIWAARRRHSSWPLLTLLASIVGISVPSFFAALLLQLGVIQLTRISGRTWLPVGGFEWDWHLLLPALVLAARPLAQITRVTFVTLNDVLQQDYVRTAYSKGLNARLVMNRHVIKNAAIPVLTTIGLSLRFSMSSLPVVEFFFGWPGMGFTLLKSIAVQDDNLTVALVLCLGVIFILVNLILDLVYRLIDPRLRTTPDHIHRSDRFNVLESLRPWLTAIRQFFSVSLLQRWRQARRSTAAPSPFRVVLDEHGEEPETYVSDRAGERRAWMKGTLGNLPLLAGLVLMAGLVAVVLFGPQIAPHSPYTTRGLEFVNGKFNIPPFPPDSVYPLGTDVLGRDMLSLILAGAQQTLFLAVLVVLARLGLGFILGALAGWFNGSWIDRLLMSAAEMISAFPTLLLAMILILALGIREGLRPFVIALCFVGWGEIMQFVRSEVINVRPKLYIEGAVALGVRTPRIILVHILPNLVPALISLTALEMGAVLMLLGELGFIGIFIGGGAFAELDVAAAPYHYSDAPEWGALLSNVRAYARAYPWTAIYPSLAFFTAILGFNLFGEGMRRLIENVGVRIMNLFNRYTAAISLVLVAGFLWMRGSTGSLAYYQKEANGFSATQTMAYLEKLSSPEMQGRALGSEGLQLSAQWIASAFEELGIQPAGDNLTYFQPRSRSYETLDAIPVLEVNDGGPPLVYHTDFNERPAAYRNLGDVRRQVRVVLFGNLQSASRMSGEYVALRDYDFSNDILLLLSESDLDYLRLKSFAGALVVTENPLDLQRRFTLSSLDPFWQIFGFGRALGQDAPLLWINPQTAQRLLTGTGQTVDGLLRQEQELHQDEIIDLSTSVEVHMTVQGSVVDKAEVNHVIGYWPGSAALGDNGTKLDNKLVVVMAQYDAPPLGPDGQIYPAADDNASGVAVMLEAVRNMRQSGYQPKRTFLFVAYSGEGSEGGAPYKPEVAKFLQTKVGFANAYDVETIIELRGLGSNDGSSLVLSTGGSLRLANLFESAARRMHAPSQRAGENMDLSIVFGDRSPSSSAEEAPGIGLSWKGWETTSRAASDVLTNISSQHLEQSGRTLSLALMILGRELNY